MQQAVSKLGGDHQICSFLGINHDKQNLSAALLSIYSAIPLANSTD